MGLNAWEERERRKNLSNLIEWSRYAIHPYINKKKIFCTSCPSDRSFVLFKWLIMRVDHNYRWVYLIIPWGHLLVHVVLLLYVNSSSFRMRIDRFQTFYYIIRFLKRIFDELKIYFPTMWITLPISFKVITWVLKA